MYIVYLIYPILPVLEQGFAFTDTRLMLHLFSLNYEEHLRSSAGQCMYSIFVGSFMFAYLCAIGPEQSYKFNPNHE